MENILNDSTTWGVEANKMNNNFSNLNANIEGGKVPLLTKVATDVNIDFDVDGDIISLSTLFYIRCKNANGTIPSSVNYSIRNSGGALGSGTITLDANGEGSYTINNIDTTIFRLQNITAGFTASIISDEQTVGKRLAAVELEVEQIPQIAINTASIEDVNTNIEGGKLAILTKVATGVDIDFDVDGDTISLSTLFYIRCRNANGTIPSSVNYSVRNTGGALASGTISLDANGEGSYTVTQSEVTIFRLQNITAGFTASIISDEQTVGKRLAAVELEVEKLRYFGETFTSTVNMESGSIYENCVFNTIQVFANDFCTIKNCDFVNSILQSTPVYGLNKVNILNNKFIGNNSRIHVCGIYDSVIDSNDFPVSDSRYPSATAKTTGEASRNIFTNVLSRCIITNNRMHTGRTGIIVLADYDKMKDDVLLEYSSCNNIINGNVIEGIGEEHISFDGSCAFDVGKITAVSTEFVEVSTGQMINGDLETSDQTKIVARVTLSLESQLLGIYPFDDGMHIKEFPAFLKNGLYGIGLRNSKYYKIVSISLTGTTANDPADSLDYSVSGTYDLTIEIPTIYNYKRTMTAQNETDNTAAIIADWSVDDYVCVGGIQSKNVISGNIIEGIGTDALTDIDDMGGIVLYGICFHNTVNNNVLRQKRVWLQQWNNSTSSYQSKIKMQSYNTISNNTLIDTSISMVNISITGFNGSMIINRGNRLIGNVVTGFYDVAGINVVKEAETTLIGNTARHYRLSYNDGLKLIGNSKETSDNQVLTGNTNVVADATDDIQS